MSPQIELTALYLDVLSNAMGLAAGARPDGAVKVELDNSLVVVVRHFAPARPDLLQVSASFHASQGIAVLTEVFTRLNPELKGAKFIPARVGDGYICTVEMIVAPRGGIPTIAHLKNVLPRALGMLTHAVRALAKEISADEDNSGAAA